MPADRPRAWQYMGAEPFADVVDGPGDHYIAVIPLTPDDIPLAPPVEVTAEDIESAATDAMVHDFAVDDMSTDQLNDYAKSLTERLAARQEGE